MVDLPEGYSPWAAADPGDAAYKVGWINALEWVLHEDFLYPVHEGQRWDNHEEVENFIKYLKEQLDG